MSIYGFSPLSPDPLTDEEVPVGQVRDFLGDLVSLPELADVVHRNDESVTLDSGARVEIEAESGGRASLLIDDIEVGHVSYVTVTPDGVELTVAGVLPEYTGKLLLKTVS